MRNLKGANLAGANLKEATLNGANLEGANLTGANLNGANLNGANLNWANLTGANLTGANLTGANLNGAKLNWANLKGASLTGATFEWANLTVANLEGANLEEAILEKAILNGANLKEAKLPNFQKMEGMGDVTAYKKVQDGYILELLIKADTPRTCSLVGNKCRAKSAFVVKAFGDNLGITDMVEFRSLHNPNFVYVVGQEVTEPDYDPDIRYECTSGIHFFLSMEEARRY